MTYDELKAHLERTGRMKLLSRILRELRVREARERKFAPLHETAAENPALISGWRSIENGILTDRSAKRALIDMYQKIIT